MASDEIQYCSFEIYMGSVSACDCEWVSEWESDCVAVVAFFYIFYIVEMLFSLECRRTMTHTNNTSPTESSASTQFAIYEMKQ